MYRERQIKVIAKYKQLMHVCIENIRDNTIFLLSFILFEDSLTFERFEVSLSEIPVRLISKLKNSFLKNIKNTREKRI